MIEFSPEERERERRNDEMRQRYRNIFGSEEGRRVLGHILAENHFGVPLNNEVERIEYNVAVAIARMSGTMSQIDELLGIGEE
jgi:hypothetical protein